VEVKTDAAHSTLQRLQEAMVDVQADKGRCAQIADTFAFYW
jgi:cation transport ATPase